MRVFDAATVRNVAIVGHSGAGKTQLASALVFDAGAVTRLGKVDDGTTVTDYDEEAIARKHTLGASLASFEWNKHKVNLIDTPGVGNFLGDARAALRVAELAVVVVDAVSGVQVSTEKVWALADEAELPRLVVVNRLDRERASLARTLDSMRGTLGRNVVPIQLPIGDEKDFKGVVDLVGMKALLFAPDESGRMTEAPVPDALASEARAARDTLIEMVAEADDGLMEKFFDAGTLTQEELSAGLARAVRAARIFPVLCASGLRNIGVGPIADAILAYAPSPADRPFPGTTPRPASPRPGEAKAAAPFVLWVWKTIADPFAGRITMFRVLSGVLKADATVHNITRDAPERMGHLLVLQGKAHDAGARTRRRRPRRRSPSSKTLTPATRSATKMSPALPSQPSPSRSRSWPTRSSRSRAATRTRSARRCSGCARRIRPSATAATRRPTSSCCRARDSSISR